MGEQPKLWRLIRGEMRARRGGCAGEMCDEVQVMRVHDLGHNFWDRHLDSRKVLACPERMGQVAARGTIPKRVQKSARILLTMPAQQVTSSECGVETRPPYS